MKAFALVAFIVVAACGGKSTIPTGTVTITGLQPNEPRATAIASYAYGGDLNNTIPLITVSFYDHAATACDGRRCRETSR